MIKLEQLDVWSKLSSPYGNSEEIPSLLLKLFQTPTKDIADKIIWEYIYHQGTIYENTLATVPYLIQLIDKTNNIDFKFDLLLSLGIVLVGLDSSSNLDKEIFHNNNLDKKVKSNIKTAFFDSLEKFDERVSELFPKAKYLDEQSKVYFLIAYLVTKNKHTEANIFIRYSENDEYIFVCPVCEEETYLWNENNRLNAYSKDPVFHASQEKLKIYLDESNTDLEWLNDAIKDFEINSLKSIIKYFEAKIKCHHCHTSSNIFEGIANST